jgi:hypothetical protein
MIEIVLGPSGDFLAEDLSDMRMRLGFKALVADNGIITR